jgi:beta-N-acetylhexosaminidase
MMTLSALILGCSGPVLTPDEASFFRDVSPWGYILFRRNIQNPEQVYALTSEIRSLTGRDDVPILIDQEGGRVQRMSAPHWPVYPCGRAYGAAAAGDPLLRRGLTWLGARLIAEDLRGVGINVDCVPVLDVPVPGSHAVIGDRAYGEDPGTVSILGRAAAEGLLAGGVLPVIKHIPGHGRAGADSHHALPVVEASREDLEIDFAPFRALSDMPLAMTAHVVYTALDPVEPATTSAIVMNEIIRGAIGFDGLVMSDDLSMNALSGTLTERAAAAFGAGCDIGLHCNGIMAEMVAVADAAPPLAGEPKRRADAALKRIVRAPEPIDLVDARARFEAALAMVA